MSNYFDSHMSNYLVGVAAKVSKSERAISKEKDGDALVELYNSIQNGCEMMESAMRSFEEKMKLKIEGEDNV